MKDVPLVIAFENSPFPRHHLKELTSRFTLVHCFPSIKPSPPATVAHHDFGIESTLIVDGEISWPRFLFELRDMLAAGLITQLRPELLIWGGTASYAMAQYYIFKALVHHPCKIHLVDCEREDGRHPVMDVLADEEFDGLTHVFEKGGKLGFDAWYEVSPHHQDRTLRGPGRYDHGGPVRLASN